jgi:hypothetical protein
MAGRRAIGILEILGVRVVAIIVHVRRKDTLTPVDVVLLALALFVGIGLLVVL